LTGTLGSSICSWIPSSKSKSNLPGELAQVCAEAITHGIPIPGFAAALTYYDGYRCQRLPANLLQAQRDYFGAHKYERIDGQRVRSFTPTGPVGAEAPRLLLTTATETPAAFEEWGFFAVSTLVPQSYRKELAGRKWKKT